jgi:hypothetical protein
MSKYASDEAVKYFSDLLMKVSKTPNGRNSLRRTYTQGPDENLPQYGF